MLRQSLKASAEVLKDSLNRGFYFAQLLIIVMLTKQEKKEYRTLGKIILNGSIDEVNKITSRYLELNQKRYNPFYGRVNK